ncbi:alpha beta-hydrolase [Leucogyrophana mollusca]|uniref:Alpha beta-hydrolase n=1 Tax=Leucogyrophana mollusca TaxID=85980 RepID=A0ACB8BP81_9AGAM|nr:alpha beta-hydrolase [Leucogyrophana mollusca]
MSSLKHNGTSPLFIELTELPVPTSAEFIKPNDGVLRVTYSVRDNERNAKKSVTKTFSLNGGSPVTAQESPEIKASTTSLSTERQAILREASEKRFVEIWAGAQLEACLEVTKAHGEFHTNEFTSSLSFSPSETALLYTAEANPPIVQNLSEDPYPKFRYTPHFGETLHSQKRPTIYLFRWRSPAVAASPRARAAKEDLSLIALSPAEVETVPVLFGQAVFATEERIFATGYEHTKDGRILGIKYCPNRPAGIWELTLPTQDALGELDDRVSGSAVACSSTRLTLSERSCRSPRVLRDASGTPTKLLWLSNPVGGAHSACVQLYSRDLRSDSGDKVLVDTVFEAGEKEFPGLYLDYNLPASPFTEYRGHTYVAMHSLWRSRSTVLFVDVDSGEVSHETEVFSGGEPYSWKVLSTDGYSRLVCTRSTPTIPSEVVLGAFDRQGNLNWTLLDRPALSMEATEALNGLKHSVVSIPERYPTDVLVIQPKEVPPGPKPICITYPHGGPHSTSTTAFSPAAIALALEGYTLSMPNYTGSLGFGEKWVQKLIGECGTLDVGDCIATVEHLITSGISERGRQFVQGGSHGGFLAGHLIGQYPDVFQAAVLANPVISCGEISTSDIPDWYFAEFGLSFEPDTLLTPETYKKLFNASPIAHVDKVRTPVLLAIGEDDLRVAPTQGRGYYHALKGRGKQVEMLTFPKETHPIDGVEASRVWWEATRDWLRVVAEQM